MGFAEFPVMILQQVRMLAEGTSRQKQRAWGALVSDGRFWRECQAVLAEPAALEILSECYPLLQSSWERSPVIALAEGDAGAIETLIGCALQVIAAAAVAVSVRDPAGPPPTAREWVFRSLGEPPGSWPLAL